MPQFLLGAQACALGSHQFAEGEAVRWQFQPPCVELLSDATRLHPVALAIVCWLPKTALQNVPALPSLQGTPKKAGFALVAPLPKTLQRRIQTPFFASCVRRFSGKLRLKQRRGRRMPEGELIAEALCDAVEEIPARYQRQTLV
jgi:hypothetical protein